MVIGDAQQAKSGTLDGMLHMKRARDVFWLELEIACIEAVTSLIVKSVQ